MDDTPISAAREDLLKSAHASLAVRWGTSAPFAIGKVRPQRIGFASIPCVTVTVNCRRESIPAMVPILRQCIYGELAERGWTPDDVEFTPSVECSGRERLFVDENDSSPSCGRRKRGIVAEFRWEMKPELARQTFDPRVRPGGNGYYATLPERREV